jgi:hypothetical protein
LTWFDVPHILDATLRVGRGKARLAGLVSGMSAEERSKENLKNLATRIAESKDRLGKAVLQLAMSRTDSRVNLCFATVNFLRKSEQIVEEIHYDYGQFVIVRKLGEVSDVLKTLTNLEKAVLIFPDLEEVLVPGGFWREPILNPSDTSYGPVELRWPTWYCEYSVDRASKGNIPDDALVNMNLPLFSNGRSAIKSLFCLRPEYDRWSDPLILFLVPDYRARIDNVRIVGNSVTVKVETKEMNEESLVAKFYCESHAGTEYSANVQITDSIAGFCSKGEPFYVDVHILNSSTGEDLDRCDFDFRRSRAQEKVILEKAQYQMEELIGRGESHELEFKVDLKEPTRFLKAVVAFANSNGGRILLGVDDNAQVIGYHGDDVDRITNLISSNCNPPIEVLTRRVELKEPILVVEVHEGTNKPYEYREKGFYVRRGATSVLMTRSEIDQIYSRKSKSELPQAGAWGSSG